MVRGTRWREAVIVLAMTFVCSAFIAPAAAQGDLVYVANADSGIISAHSWRATYPPSVAPFLIATSDTLSGNHSLVTANLVGDDRDDLVVIDLPSGSGEVFKGSLLPKQWFQPLGVNAITAVTAGNVVPHLGSGNRDQLIVATALHFGSGEWHHPKLHFFSWDEWRFIPQPAYFEGYSGNWWPVSPGFSEDTQIAAGRVHSADWDSIVIADPIAGRVRLFGTIADNGSWFPRQKLADQVVAYGYGGWAFGPKDRMALGDIDGDGRDEVLFVTDNPAMWAANWPKEPGLLAGFRWKECLPPKLCDGLGELELLPEEIGKATAFRAGDALLVADVLGDGREEVLIAKADEGFVYIYQWGVKFYDLPNTATFAEVAKVPTTFDNKNDRIAAGAGGVCNGYGPCEESNRAPLVYETNPWSVKYDFSEVDKAANQSIFKWSLIPGLSDIDGLTLAVVRKGEGQVYEQAYGAFKRDRISLVASVSKTLSAGVILSLVDEGKLELDRPIKDYLDQDQESPPWGDHHPDVTMRHLLSMMSGLQGAVHVENHNDCLDELNTSLRECGQRIFQTESNFIIPPEKKFTYGENHWQLAGAVAQIVSGTPANPWARLVNERLGSCGLQNTYYSNQDKWLECPEPCPYPYSMAGVSQNKGVDPGLIPPTDNPEIGGGVATTVNDLSKVLLMHLDGGRCGQTQVLSPTLVKEMQDDHAKDDFMDWPSGTELECPVTDRRRVVRDIDKTGYPRWAWDTIDQAKAAAKTWKVMNYGMGWYRYEFDVATPDPPVTAYVGPGARGARLVLVPDEAWGAVLIIEAQSAQGDQLLAKLFPLIRKAIQEADRN